MFHIIANKTEDLEIGNWVLKAHLGTTNDKLFKEYQIKAHDRANPDHFLYKLVPLSDKKLRGFGFVKNKGDSFENIALPYWAKDSVLLFFNPEQKEYAWKVGYGEMNMGKYYVVTFYWIEYVHQLQNLYFPLTKNKLS